MTKLRSRPQAPAESVESYIYMLELCRQLELEQNTRITELEYLLQGLFLERLWPLIPELVNTTDLFLSTAVKYEQAREAADNRDWKPTKHVKLNELLSREEPEMISREEFEKLNAEVRDLTMQQQKKKNEKQSPALYQKTQFQPNGRLGEQNRYNRTADGRPICHLCHKPGHIARFCRQNYQPPQNQRKTESWSRNLSYQRPTYHQQDRPQPSNALANWNRKANNWNSS